MRREKKSKGGGRRGKGRRGGEGKKGRGGQGREQKKRRGRSKGGEGKIINFLFIYSFFLHTLAILYIAPPKGKGKYFKSS